MNDSDLLRLADLNRMEYWRESLNWIPGTEVFEDQDAVFINSVVDFPACNIVLMRSRGTAEVISRAQQFFSQRKRSFALLLRNHGDQDAIKFCRGSKMLMISDNAGMALEQPVNKKKLRDGAELHWVEDAKGLEGFEQVTAEAYQDLGLPAAITHKYFALADRVLSPYSIWAVVYYQDEPAAAAMAILSHGIAGIYWVACAKKSRAGSGRLLYAGSGQCSVRPRGAQSDPAGQSVWRPRLQETGLSGDNPLSMVHLFSKTGP